MGRDPLLHRQGCRARLRTTIVHEMAVAYLEFGLQVGIRKIIGICRPTSIAACSKKPGIEMEYLGPVTIDRQAQDTGRRHSG